MAHKSKSSLKRAKDNAKSEQHYAAGVSENARYFFRQGFMDDAVAMQKESARAYATARSYLFQAIRIKHQQGNNSNG